MRGASGSPLIQARVIPRCFGRDKASRATDRPWRWQEHATRWTTTDTPPESLLRWYIWSSATTPWPNPPSPRARSTISLPHIKKKTPRIGSKRLYGSKLQLQINSHHPHERSDATHLPEAVVGSVRPKHEEEAERPRHDRVRDGGNLKTPTRTPGQNHRKGWIHTYESSLTLRLDCEKRCNGRIGSMTRGKKKRQELQSRYMPLYLEVVLQESLLYNYEVHIRPPLRFFSAEELQSSSKCSYTCARC